MNILALGDPHGKLPKDLKHIIKENKIEVIVCVGDIAPVGRHGKRINIPTDEIQADIIKKLASYKIPFLTLRGNMYVSSRYSKAIFTKEIKKYKNVYSKNIGKVIINGQPFIFFDYLYEKESARFLTPFVKRKMKSNEKNKKRLDKLLKENKNSIILAHNPPYGYVDKIVSGKHVGSRILLNAIKKHQPKIALCGHIHESKGEARIGKTKVYNLGEQGAYKILSNL